MTTIFLDGVVGWEITSKDVNEQLANATGDIEFEMNSPGGYISEGVSIQNAIRNYKKGETIAKISHASSMMTQIALVCDKVKVYDNAIFMVHNAQGGIYGDHIEMRKQADLQERMSNMLAKLYVKKTGKSEEEIKKMLDETTYLFGEEIVSNGFADEVIPTDNNKDKVLAIAFANDLMDKSEKAIKQEALNLLQLEENFKACENGLCSLEKVAAMPDASVPKLVNKTIGADMKFDKDNLEQTEANFNALVGNRETLQRKNESLELKLETSQTALATKTEELSALQAEMTSKVSEAEGKLASFEENTVARLQEAIATKVPLEVALAMVKADSPETASVLALAAKSNTDALRQGEQESLDSKQSNELAYAQAIARQSSI